LSTLDAALAAAACTPDDLATELALHDRLKGIRQARELVPLADPRAQCRQESHLRLILHDGGVTGLVPQHRVTDDEGAITYYLDLADVRRRIGIEYDGSSHLDRTGCAPTASVTTGWRATGGGCATSPTGTLTDDRSTSSAPSRRPGPVAVAGTVRIMDERPRMEIDSWPEDHDRVR
jgi:hypothetical protein